jgi:hypothetical protein
LGNRIGHPHDCQLAQGESAYRIADLSFLPSSPICRLHSSRATAYPLAVTFPAFR